MADASRRAARASHKGGLPNALFVAAGAERPPDELQAIAAEVTIHFPWGSLLRGALALDDGAEAARGIASLVAPGGIVRALLSIDPRDQLAIPAIELGHRECLAARWARHGLTLVAFEPATTGDIESSGSSWARRLAAGRDRRAWRVELRRTSAPAGVVIGARDRDG